MFRIIITIICLDLTRVSSTSGG